MLLVTIIYSIPVLVHIIAALSAQDMAASVAVSVPFSQQYEDKSYPRW